MTERVFDRRGRRNWQEDVRLAEDDRLAERRAGDVRARDRRQKDRRQGAPDLRVEGAPDRRRGDRRTGDRRSQSSTPATIRGLLGDRFGVVLNLPIQALMREAVEFLAAHKIGLVVISSEQGGLVGVLSERDIVKALAESGNEALDQPVEEHMIRGVWACRPEDRPESVLLLMSEHRMRHLPVLEEGQIVGMVSATDLLDYFTVRIQRQP